MTLCRGSAARGRTGKVAGQGRRSVHAVSMATEDQEKKDTGGISEGDNDSSEEGTVVSVCVCVLIPVRGIQDDCDTATGEANEARPPQGSGC